MVRACSSLIAALLLLAACDPPPAVDELSRVRVVFDLPESSGAVDMGAIPFPDDLYRDADGQIALGAIPSEELSVAEGYPEAIRSEIARLDGFSGLAPVFFYFEGEGALDPATLPQSPAASTRDDSTVILVDADSGSDAAFRRVPVRVNWNPALRQLALRPYEGHPLQPGRRYAAIVTTAVLDDAGEPVGCSEQFQGVRDAMTRPEDAASGRAFDHYSGLLASLASNGVPRDSIAGLALFTVQTVAPALTRARATVWRDAAPVLQLDASYTTPEELDALLGVPTEEGAGADTEGGVAHSRIGALIHGHFASPWLLGAVEEVHGRFEPDDDGGFVVGRSEEVPFTLTLPAGAVDNVPVVIYQHGLGSERSSMLAVADTFAAAGYAVFAIDIPFHGMRTTEEIDDFRHNFGDGEGADGFGDRGGLEVQLDYFGVIDQAGPLPPFHPIYIRDVLRQSVVDLMRGARGLREGDWAAVRAVPGLEALAFADEPMTFIGVSLGGIVGTIFVAGEPEIGAAALVVTGGDLPQLTARSGSFGEVFLPLLLPNVGVDPTMLQPDYPAIFHPEVALISTLLDAGDSMLAARLLADADKDLLFLMAQDDETVPNFATEALARAAGAVIVDADPTHTDLARVGAPVMSNVELADGRATRGLTVFSPATHGLITSRRGQHRFEHPVDPPFAQRQEPALVDNPVDAAQAQILFFFESFRGGEAQVAAPNP